MTGTDVAVIGAGPAGAIASRVLALAGFNVTLVDPGPGQAKIGESLSGAARPLLRDLGLLPWLERSQPQVCVGNWSAWGEETLRVHDAIRDPYGPGWHLDRACFDHCLREAACTAGVQWRHERLKQVQRFAGGWRLQLSETQICARWLIDASGRAAILARRLGIRRVRDQQLVAVYAWGRGGSQQDRRTLIESAGNGWWYSAPLPHGRRIAALHTSADVAATIQCCPSLWLEQLAETRHLAGLCAEGLWALPHACDASGGQAQQAGGQGWLAVGDAALAFDPLSAQGLFNALYTGLRGAQAVQGALEGQATALQSYISTLQKVRRAYLRQLQGYYAVEGRWPDQPFWQARKGG